MWWPQRLCVTNGEKRNTVSATERRADDWPSYGTIQVPQVSTGVSAP